MRKIGFALAAWALAMAVGLAADEFALQMEYNWHQFRGPDGSGVSPHGNPPVNWDENTNIKWKLAIPGDSVATPIIWGNDVFAISAVETDREGTTDYVRPPFSETEATRMRGMGIVPASRFHQFFVYGIDRATGKVKWQKMVRDEVPHEGRHNDGSFAAMTPTTDGKYLYVSFGSRGIYCFDFTGNQIWTRDLGKMDIWASYGESTSPVLHGDTLVLQWDHESAAHMYALDAKTGATRWKIDRDEKTSFSTPLVTDFQGRSQIITYGKKNMRSTDLATGEPIWECKVSFSSSVPIPIRYKDIVMCMSGYQGYELLAVKLDSKGDITGTDQIVWEAKQGTPWCPSALLYGDMLYFTQTNTAILSCLKADDGEKIIDRKRLQGLSGTYASPVGAADRIYIPGREGVALVLKKGPTVEILATNKLDDPIDGSPAVVGNELFLRSRKSLYCISE